MYDGDDTLMKKKYQNKVHAYENLVFSLKEIRKNLFSE